MNEQLRQMMASLDLFLQSASPADVGALRPLAVRLLVVCIVSDLVSRPQDLSYLASM